MRYVIMVTLTAALLGVATADMRPPDLWVELDNNLYFALLNQFGDEIFVYDISLNPSALLGDTAADGYFIPLALTPIYATSHLTLELPRFNEDNSEAGYHLTIHYATTEEHPAKAQPAIRARYLEAPWEDYVKLAESPLTILLEQIDYCELDFAFLDYYNGTSGDDAQTTSLGQVALLLIVTPGEPPPMDGYFRQFRECVPESCLVEIYPTTSSIDGGHPW